ncbi:uncharacterized protein LOC102721368 [Oryza brachyantha]|uniref:uncharacterized protein LOC102721368 n=1 Tax=Oryza brachyantha TaxID=4533 RepID=UPI001ADB0FE7|nr:uncharacterized protein LOC102721368 [Oryza brachyantha]
MPPDGGEAASKPQSPLRITHDGEFYARLLTKESSQGNPSFRYYAAGAGAVPFVWESHPGTPKVDATSSCMLASGAAADVPAITPPPSYHLRAAAVSSSHGHSGRIKGGGGGGGGGRSSKYCGYYKLKWIKIGFIAAVFRRLALGKSRASSSSTVQPSPSTRWLFSGSDSVETSDHQAAPPSSSKGGLLCLSVRPSPWMVQFCGGRSIRRIDTGSWATSHGWA